jgi:outer membrane protein assembly factor BamB
LLWRIAAASVAAFGLLVTGRGATAASHAHLEAPLFRLSWEDVVDPSAPIALSSPAVATLEHRRVAVVGDLAGRLYALQLANGSEIPGWPASTGGAPIESPPSIDGERVFVGAGSAAAPFTGGYFAFGANGRRLWVTKIRYTPSVASPRGVEAGLTVADLQRTTAVVAGSLGQFLDALRASTGAALSGFPWFQADTVFSTAAVADLYHNGQTEIVEGGDSTAGRAFGAVYGNGGHVRVLAATGNSAIGAHGGGLICQHNTDQVVQSSPAVGPFLQGGAEGIVVGTGTYYGGASSTNVVLALTSRCALAWATRLSGATVASPALVAALGGGRLEIAEGTDQTTSGAVYLLDGSTGKVLWRQAALGPVIGGITSADLGGGYQDLVVPTTRGVEVLDGRTGAVVAVLETVVGVQSSPLVTDDPNGTLGITIAGYKAGGTGVNGEAVVEHFELDRPGSGARATEAGSWPEFHGNPRLTGNA